MLPAGLSADPAPFPDQQALKSIHPDARTVARILAGRCSCDLVRARQADSRQDERHLRERYRQLGIPRGEMVAALERHRRAPGSYPSIGREPQMLAGFVVEHSRNAGPTLYYLHFCSHAQPLAPARDFRPVPSRHVTPATQEWLQEGIPSLVAP